MQLTRGEKEELVEELSDRVDSYPVVGLLDMHSLPARQLQEIKKELVGEAEIKMARKTLLHLALEQSGKENVEELEDNDAVQPALIFTEKNPFSLFKLIQNKKSSAPASGGEVAPSDIVVEDGMTELDPGPMLGRIQELGAETSVEEGKIKIENSAVAVEAGEVIDSDTAEILNNLGMEPLEVGLDLKLVYEDGEVFGRDVLEVDEEEYRQDVEAAASRAFNLAVNAGHLTSRTSGTVVQEAVSKARNLAVNAGIFEEDVVEDLIRKAAGEAEAVDAEIDLESVETGEEEEVEEEAEEGEEETEDEGEEQADGEEDSEEEPSEEGESGEDADEDNDVDRNGSGNGKDS